MALQNPFRNMPKPALYATIAGSVLVFGYVGYKHHQSTGSWNPFSSGTGTSSAGTATSIDPVTGLAYSQDNATDPLTGQQYLAEAQQYGSVAAAEASVSAYGQSTATGSGIPVNPASPAPSGSINTPVGTSVYTSNAAWAQAVQAGLTDVGYNATDVAQALGLYLTGQPMTAAQAQLINTGIAEFGAAPVGSLQVILKPSSGPSDNTMVQVPDVIGQTAGNAHNAIVAAGLVPVDPVANRPGEPQDKVASTTPTGGTSVTKGSRVTINAEPYVKVPRIIGMKAGQAHNTLVSAGLTPADAKANDPGEPQKRVVNQSPEAGADVPKGTHVSIIT